MASYYVANQTPLTSAELSTSSLTRIPFDQGFFFVENDLVDMISVIVVWFV